MLDAGFNLNPEPKLANSVIDIGLSPFEDNLREGVSPNVQEVKYGIADISTISFNVRRGMSISFLL